MRAFQCRIFKTASNPPTERRHETLAEPASYLAKVRVPGGHSMMLGGIRRVAGGLKMSVAEEQFLGSYVA